MKGRQFFHSYLVLFLLILVTNIITAQTVLFYDDFESGMSNWSVSGNFGLSSSDYYSSSNSLTESPSGNYTNMQTMMATLSSGINLSTYLGAEISFYAKYNIVALPVHDSFIVRSSHRLDLLKEMDKAFEEVVGIKPKRDIKELKLGKKVAIKEAKRFYGDTGEWLYDEEGNLEGVIIKASSTYELINKRDKEYQGYHLRRGEWIEHKGYI